MEMGHGDELVIGDGNFPAASMAQRLVRADGLGVPPLLEGILQLFPLDPYVDKPVALMQVVPGDPYQPVIWREYQEIVSRHEPDLRVSTWWSALHFTSGLKKPMLFWRPAKPPCMPILF